MCCVTKKTGILTAVAMAAGFILYAGMLWGHHHLKGRTIRIASKDCPLAGVAGFIGLGACAAGHFWNSSRVGAEERALKITGADDLTTTIFFAVACHLQGRSFDIILKDSGAFGFYAGLSGLFFAGLITCWNDCVSPEQRIVDQAAQNHQPAQPDIVDPAVQNHDQMPQRNDQPPLDIDQVMQRARQMVDQLNQGHIRIRRLEDELGITNAMV